jgi:hypothetical protein
MKMLHYIILLIFVVFGAACSKDTVNQLNQENTADKSLAFSCDEVDETVEEALPNYGTPKAIDEWLGESNQNKFDFMSREDSLAVFREVQNKHSIDLQAVVSHKKPTSSHTIIGRIHDGVDLKSLKKVMGDSSSDNLLDVEFGDRWVWMTGKIVGEGDESYQKKIEQVAAPDGE